MATRFVITDHALDRFIERAELDYPEPDQYRALLVAELDWGVPFGGQVGTDELYLLPCGLVAAVAWDHGSGFVKTVLTREYAIANMESRGAILRFSSGPPAIQDVDLGAVMPARFAISLR